VLAVACKKNAPVPPSPVDPPAETNAATLTIDRKQPLQTIDGFGFFGAQSVWWDGNAGNLYSDAWAEQAITDLGITIWRNEYYPPATAMQGQDADWNKQKPVVEGLARVARSRNVPLKFIFTVWSPPEALKCSVSSDDVRQPGIPHAGGTKNGGTLDPGQYTNFGNWLADGIELYRQSSAEVYAISPQNEPLFKQTFNSCFYKPEWYAQMLTQIVPVVKARFPNVKIFGPENMLGMEGGNDRQYFYHNYLMNNATARQQLDIWAVHGYVEGVTPSATSQMARLWQTVRTEQAAPASKPVWMTETSGYVDTWPGTTDKPGPLDLALAIHSALYHGQAAAWVWWQGSDLGALNEYNLMQGAGRKSKRYYVSKHFYRFIRPGARMVKAMYNDAEGVLGSAYEHPQMGAFTVVLVNTGTKTAKITLNGNDLPDTFDFYQTTATDNCVKKDPVQKDNILLPPQSIVTLVNGNVYE
jgi:O-glycosyl hydrolase